MKGASLSPLSKQLAWIKEERHSIVLAYSTARTLLLTGTYETSPRACPPKYVGQSMAFEYQPTMFANQNRSMEHFTYHFLAALS